MAEAPEAVSLERAGDLKRALVAMEWADEAVSGELGRLREERARQQQPWDDSQMDAFLLEHRLPDGRRPVEVFADEAPGLTEAERAMLRRWTDVVEGVFRIGPLVDGAVALHNEIDDLDYRVRSNHGEGAVAELPRTGYFICRLVPFGDGWIFSGPVLHAPSAARRRLLEAAAQTALQHPQLVLRNPRLLAAAREQQRIEYEAFVQLFGSDEIVGTPREIQSRLDDYIRYRTFQWRGADGRTPAEWVAEKGGRLPPLPRWSLPDELFRCRSVGVLANAEGGFVVLPEYAEFLRAFEAAAAPDAVPEPAAVEHVLAYLRAESIGPLPFERAGRRDPGALSRVLAVALGRPDFDWGRDGAALMREYKPAFAEGPRRLTAPVLPPRLLAYLHGTPERNAPCPCGSGRKFKRCCDLEDAS